MIRVHFASTIQPWAWFRQTPGGDGIWKELAFSLDDPDQEADWLVVYDSPQDRLPTRVPRERRILFTCEPPELKEYYPEYLNQFGVAVGPLTHASAFRGDWFSPQPTLNWYYGVNLHQADRRVGALGWEALAAPKTDKIREISIVCSNQAYSDDHRLRLAFLEKLRAHFGSRLDCFGRGFNDIADKAQALAAYRYHIAVENNRIGHFWTEKLADPVLAGCYTFHHGGAGVDQYFDTAAITSIDITRPHEAIAAIERVLADDPWPRLRAVFDANRRRLMEEHNVFEVVRRIIQSRATAQAVPDLRRAERLRVPHRSRRQDQLRWAMIDWRNGVRAWFTSSR